MIDALQSEVKVVFRNRPLTYAWILRALREIREKVATHANNRWVVLSGTHEDSLKLAVLLLHLAELKPIMVQPVKLPLIKRLFNRVCIAQANGVCRQDDAERLYEIQSSLFKELGLVFSVEAGQGPDRARRDNIALALDESDYGLLTSGTVTESKLILGRFRAVREFVAWENRILDEITDQSYSYNCAALTPLGFDPLYRDILLPVLTNGTLTLPSHKRDRNEVGPPLSFETVSDWRCNVWHTTPGILRRIMTKYGAFDHSLTVLTAGEEVLPNDAKNWFDWINPAHEQFLVSLYGLSEATLAQFARRIALADADAKQIPLGSARPNITWEIADENEVSELVLCGSGFAHGALELGAGAAEFVRFEDKIRTGDRINLTAQGELLFQGRIGREFKYMGSWVQPDQIEQYLRIEFADHLFLMTQSPNPNIPPCIFYSEAGNVSQTGIGIQEEEIALAIRKEFGNTPSFRVSKLVEMPLTDRGKIDTQQLRLLNSESYRSMTVEEIVSTENFIRKARLQDLGWDSLQVVELAVYLEDQFDVYLSLEKLLSLTVEQIQSLLPTNPKSADKKRPQMPSLPRDDFEGPVSLSQMRFLDHPAMRAVPQAFNFGWIVSHSDFSADHLIRAAISVIKESRVFSIWFRETDQGWQSSQIPKSKLPDTEEMYQDVALIDAGSCKSIERFVGQDFRIHDHRSSKCGLAISEASDEILISGTVLVSDGLSRNLFLNAMGDYLAGKPIDYVRGWNSRFRDHSFVQARRFSHLMSARSVPASTDLDFGCRISEFPSVVWDRHIALDNAIVATALSRALTAAQIEFRGIAIPYANRRDRGEWASFGCYADAAIVAIDPRQSRTEEVLQFRENLHQSITEFVPLYARELQAGFSCPEPNLVMVAEQPSSSVEKSWKLRRSRVIGALNKVHVFWNYNGSHLLIDLVTRESQIGLDAHQEIESAFMKEIRSMCAP